MFVFKSIKQYRVLWHFAIILLLLSIMPACNPTKRLQEGQYLLNRNDFVRKKNSPKYPEQVEKYVLQKPNRKILNLFRFHLWVHNLVNPEKEAKRQAKREDKRQRINAERIKKGKKPKEKLSFTEWLLKIGEEPVVLDSLLIDRSVMQMSLFLSNKGYFNNKIKDSVIFKGKKANVVYTIDAGKAYTVNNIQYSFGNNAIQELLDKHNNNRLIKTGDNYDTEVLDNERTRLTKILRNNGYYYFNKDYLIYEVDTITNPQQANITLKLRELAASEQYIYQPCIVNSIVIDPNFDIKKQNNTTSTNQLEFEDYHFVNTIPNIYKPSVISRAVLFKKGSIYVQKDQEDTYLRLSELRAFKLVNIEILQKDSVNKNDLIVYLQLTPSASQSLTLETQGTNTGGNLGINGNIIYQNRNTFKGCEIFETRLKGAMEVQSIPNTSENQTIQPYLPFNTIEAGGEIGLAIPKFLVPFGLKKTPKYFKPKTNFVTSYNFQRRPDYQRTVTNAAFSYIWFESLTKQHILSPIDLNLIRVKKSDAFEKLILDLNDQFVLNSFTDHYLLGSRYSFIYNNQISKQANHYTYLRANLETSGNMLHLFSRLTNAKKDNEGYYNLLNVRFAQFVKIDADWRYYQILPRKQTLVYRLNAGIGMPYGNSTVLPFEKSFWLGGANSMRGWQARTLGPGSYTTNYARFDQIGDIKFEANVEYRFKIIKLFEGAFFVDAGNIWLSQPKVDRPDGHFLLNNFYKQIAIDGGFGLRLNFSFFILRVDFATKLRNPAFINNTNDIINQTTSLKRINTNFAIGYPF